MSLHTVKTETVSELSLLIQRLLLMNKQKTLSVHGLNTLIAVFLSKRNSFNAVIILNK